MVYFMMKYKDSTTEPFTFAQSHMHGAQVIVTPKTSVTSPVSIFIKLTMLKQTGQ